MSKYLIALFRLK